MNTNSFKKAIAAGMIGLTALGATAVAPAIAEAQEPDASEQRAQLTEEERAERRAARQEARAAKAQELADVLGVSVEDLQAAREAGQSLADIASANGVAVETVIDHIVSNMTERIETAVSEGRITQDMADEKLAELEAKVTERVNADPSERPERGERGEGRRGSRGMRGGSETASA